VFGLFVLMMEEEIGMVKISIKIIYKMKKNEIK
jgi:hypothetical protein